MAGAACMRLTKLDGAGSFSVSESSGATMLVLIQLKGAIKLGLFGKKLLEPAIMLEGSVNLEPVFRQSFFLPFDFLLFVLGATVKRPERVLDALHRAKGVFGVELGAVGLSAPKEDLIPD
jgi:hypothetical protein